MIQRLIRLAALATIPVAGGTGVAQTSLSGPLSGPHPRAAYIVTGVCQVPAGKELRFEAGAIVYFAEFSGLEVHGSLVCAGTEQLPVVFTSLNDGPHNRSGKLPESFDWNGIAVAVDAKEVDLSHVKVKYSTAGLQVASEMTGIVLVRAQMLDCGLSCFTVAGRIMSLDAGGFVDYRSSPSAVASPTNAQPASVPAPGAQSPKRGGRPLPLAVRATCGAIVLAGAGLAVGGYLSAEKNQRSYLAQTDPSSAAASRDARDHAVVARTIGVTLGAIGAIGFCVTFLIPQLR